jgi:hypothetical protein
MSGRYAYSFDRHTFIGKFDSRADALRAAIVKAKQMEDAPTEVYVGAKVDGDPQASGHAVEVLRRMFARARSAHEGGSRYLMGVSEQDEAELDTMLEHAIIEWLKKHERLPTFYKVEAISEHPVPAMSPTAHGSDESEVTEIGTSEMPQ